MAVYGDEGMNQTELDKVYNDIIEPGLNSIDGLDHIDSIGNQEAALKIRLDATCIEQFRFDAEPSYRRNPIQSNIQPCWFSRF